MKPKNLVFTLLVSICFLFTYQYIFDKKLDLNGDNVVYYLLGKSLASGEGYVNIFTAEKSPHTQYPPGYPFVISLIIKTAWNDLDSEFLRIKLLNGLFFWAVLIICLGFFNKCGGNPFLGFVAVVLLMLNSVLLKSSTIIMSEIPFLLTVMLTFYFLCKLCKCNEWIIYLKC